MATLNVYLPDALKAEMDEIEGINWSQVAQAAFHRTIRIERIKAMDMQEAKLERLRQSRVDSAETDEASATAAGKAWALDHAEYEEIERVAAIDTDDADAFDGEAGAYGWGAVLADAVFGEGEWDRTDVERFCERHLGTAYPRGHQARGFIDGVKEVFDEV